MTDTFTTIKDAPPEIPRDQWKRPLVVPPKGGKPVGYTRCTTFVKAMEDTYNLERWKIRMAAQGLVDRPDLLLAVSAHRDNDTKLNEICEEAHEAGGGNVARNKGTALHSLTQQHDEGKDLRNVPAGFKADIEAYKTATAALEMDRDFIERFMVLDRYKIGGTPDRIVTLNGVRYIADLKTGSVDFGMLTIAQQLAVYSRSVLYDHTTATRTPVDGIDQDRAIVIHAPVETGTCNLLWVDIATGWEAVEHSAGVRKWRNRRNLAEPLVPPSTTVVGALPLGSISDLIVNASDEDALLLLWREQMPVWTPEHTELARLRKRELRKEAAS